MVAIALFAILITMISPFFGQIFVVGIIGKNLIENKKVSTYFSLVSVVIITLVALKFLTFIVAINLAMVMIITPYIFVIVFKHINNVEGAVISGGLLNVIYGFIMNFLVKKYYMDDIKSTFVYIRKGIENNNYSADTTNLMMNNMIKIEYVFTEYLSSIWSFFMILAVFFGAIILSKRTEEISWDFSKIRWPFHSIYVLIIGLFLALYPVTFQFGLKFLIIMITLYLTQGISILSYYWKDYFIRSKFLLTILIIAILFNPILIL
ncbi:MAG: hypothetical protein U9N34_09435, partial [Candidatus Cloacimonadota bacterium]|nr:hypothetical protein [Candidatus Cloacimonadota bacterium]